MRRLAWRVTPQDPIPRGSVAIRFFSPDRHLPQGWSLAHSEAPSARELSPRVRARARVAVRACLYTESRAHRKREIAGLGGSVCGRTHTYASAHGVATALCISHDYKVSGELVARL